MPNKKKVSDKIQDFLFGLDVPQKAKIIATGIKANYGTVRNELRRLLKDGKIIQVNGGYLHPSVYISDVGAIYKELMLHGIKLEFRTDPKSYKIHTSPYLMLHTNYTIHRHRTNKSITLNEIWESYKVTITIHNKPLIEVWLNCNQGINIMRFYGFTQWIQGLFPKILPSQWMVRQWGINVDYPSLLLDGIESLTLAMFQDTLLRLYNKNKDRLRVELHGNIPITMDQAILLLTNMISETKKLVQPEIDTGGK